jgi:hypothetical protein
MLVSSTFILLSVCWSVVFVASAVPASQGFGWRQVIKCGAEPVVARRLTQPPLHPSRWRGACGKRLWGERAALHHYSSPDLSKTLFLALGEPQVRFLRLSPGSGD